MNGRLKRYWILVIACAVVLITTSGCVFLPRRAFPKTTGSVTLSGLQAPVEILRDKYGVPHIYGQHSEDLFFAQGYVHAQDRFYQMEFQRRVGSGRLAELFGEKVLETDIFLRALGFDKVAEQEYKLLDEEARRYLDAYVAGVNAYIRDRKPGKISLEYSLLKLTGTDFEIEEWTPEDSLTWAKMMAWSMSSNFSLERLAVELLRTAGLAGVEDYFAPYREDMPFVLTDEELGLNSPGTSSGSSEVRFSGIERLFFSGSGTSIGSNAWAVSGDLSTTGTPILANDTHLGLQMPSIWYEVGMHTVDEAGNLVESGPDAFQMRGFTFPGYPGVIIGHNDHIAWSITDYGDDVQDLYFERINPLNPNQYEVNGEWKDMELVHERIDIQGEEEPFVHIIRKTRHGPIITDRGGYKALESYGFVTDREFPENLDLLAVSLKWTALMPGQLWMCFLRLDRATSFEEFRKAWSYFNGPILNIVYADTEGNIGYQVPGHIPIRSIGDGQIPVPGWTDEYEWTGFIPFDELPFVLNPDKGYVVTANNPAAGPNYLYDLGTSYAHGYRARRIAELIEGDQDGISVDDAVVIQGDTYDRAAVETVSYLRGLDLEAERISEYLQVKESLDKKERKKRAKLNEQVEEALEPARESLLAWDGRMEMESAEAALYGFFFLSLIEETFQDQYPYQRWPSAGARRMENALYYLLEEPDNPWWDDARTPDLQENRDDILVRAFRKGVKAGIETLGEKIEKWEWGDVHQTEFRNATLGESGIKFIENIFNIGPVATPGNTTTVFAAAWDKEEPFNVDHLTTNRWIVDMGDLGSGLMVHAPGQSGHAKHRHYDDFVDMWRNAEYHPSLWNREDVEANQRARLILKPASED